jgi:hypothetical protein
LPRLVCGICFCEVVLLMLNNFFPWQEEGVEFTQPVAQLV